MSAPALGRLLTAMVTPFDQSGEVDLRAAAQIARYLVDEGNDGVVVAGSTGEGTSLSDDEKIALFAAVKESLGSGGIVIAGTGNANTRGSVALSKRAAAVGVDALLLTVPAYCKPTQEGMLAHFGAIADATNLPIVIYNIPSRTAANLLPATLFELARRHPTIVGVKESSGDLAQISAVVRGKREGFTVWGGDDYLCLPTLAVGGAGLVSVAGHLCARELRAMIDAYARGEVQHAQDLHLQLSPLIAALFTITSPIPVKWALSELGFRVGACRPPLSRITETAAAQLAPLLEPFRERVQAARLILAR
ncbi:MAG TPA: 4-hydroxy-tetrahydrodipicolinate synthase [Candidatus Acidoferrales bacterium]|nr:4-hydroxy-tetrahydrodipicolinate synthase [Candidatus Acidoferrales bacterium]